MKVTKETLIGDVLDHNVETARFFFEIGMHCLGCPHSRGESIADACAVHGTDADALVAKLNAFLGEQGVTDRSHRALRWRRRLYAAAHILQI